MSRRIHIVGTSARSGTTLMMQLLVNCFAIDKHCHHEQHIFRGTRPDYHIYCSKHPADIDGAGALLAVDPDLWIICMVRDPRDTVVSKHKRFPDMYWGANLGQWKKSYRIAERLAGHPRFFTVRYESLVSDPNRAQTELMRGMPFLRKRADFSQFHQVARPTSWRAERALGGVRPITTRSIGAWRAHKPRLAAQLALHGDISDELVELGYEKDDAWLRELDGVAPDNGHSYMSDQVSAAATVRHTVWRYASIGRYALALMKQRAVEQWHATRQPQ
ncbi:MAG: sulfotransferase family protein [Gammaproteobacteria bacterium]